MTISRRTSPHLQCGPCAVAGQGDPAHPELRRAVLALLATFDGGKPGTVIERNAIRDAFNAAKASSPVLAAISDEIEGKRGKTPGTLAKELADMNKAGLIDTHRVTSASSTSRPTMTSRWLRLQNSKSVHSSKYGHQCCEISLYGPYLDDAAHA